MSFLRELNLIHEASVKSDLENKIQGVIDRLPLAVLGYSYDDAVEEIARKVKQKSGPIDHDILVDMIKTMFEPDDLTEAEQTDSNWPKLIAHADEFRVEMDENEQISLLDGEGTVRVTMPFIIWKQLCRQ